MLHKHLKAVKASIVVRMIHDAGLAVLLQGEDDKRESFAGVHAFGLLDHTCTLDLIFGCTCEILARAIHEDYMRNEKARGATAQINPSIVPWEELPESLRESNRSQAANIQIKLDAIGCDVAVSTDWDTQQFQFSEHERFVQERRDAGWTYSSIKDLQKKTSPTLVTWNELTEDEKDKDRATVLSLPEFLAKAGFQVYRSRRVE